MHKLTCNLFGLVWLPSREVFFPVNHPSTHQVSCCSICVPTQHAFPQWGSGVLGEECTQSSPGSGAKLIIANFIRSQVYLAPEPTLSPLLLPLAEGHMVTIPFSALLLHFLLDPSIDPSLAESSTRDSPVRLELPDGGDQVLCLSCPSGACSSLHSFLIRGDVEKWFSNCFYLRSFLHS